jgi:hypothetical protein
MICKPALIWTKFIIAVFNLNYICLKFIPTIRAYSGNVFTAMFLFAIDSGTFMATYNFVMSANNVRHIYSANETFFIFHRRGVSMRSYGGGHLNFLDNSG